MKYPGTAIFALAVLSTITLGSVIPRDDAPVGIASVVNAALSSDNASPPPFLPHPLSLLYPRADDENQDVHTMATTFCKRCSEAYVDCAKVSNFFV